MGMNNLPSNVEPYQDIFLALQLEIHKNQKLVEYMAQNVEDAMDMPERLKVIAAYFNILMDKEYIPIDVAKVLYKELREENAMRIPSASNMH